MRVTKPRKLIHFTPLRYPGGKGKIARLVKKIIEDNSLSDAEYFEPYAGGAGVALELLFHEFASHIHINDVSRPVYAFWHSILYKTEKFSQLVYDTKVTVSSWDRQRKILSNPDDHEDLALGFATFFLNRTNRSGILNGGIIGGRDQSGPWKIDARYNAPELVFRIESIANMRERISLSMDDAIDFLDNHRKSMSKKSLIYLDPPYFMKGKDLYYDFYSQKDHEKIAAYVARWLKNRNWIVSYDNVRPIRSLYRGFANIVYDLSYSAHNARDGQEVMYFSDKLTPPPSADSLHKTGIKIRRSSAKRTT